jgi:hypothetical protein
LIFSRLTPSRGDIRSWDSGECPACAVANAAAPASPEIAPPAIKDLLVVVFMVISSARARIQGSEQDLWRLLYHTNPGQPPPLSTRTIILPDSRRPIAPVPNNPLGDPRRCRGGSKSLTSSGVRVRWPGKDPSPVPRPLVKTRGAVHPLPGANLYPYLWLDTGGEWARGANTL